MFLSIATTHQPATDLGFLLMKHPERVHETQLAFGQARVFYPQAQNDRCEAVLSVEVDPIALVRGQGSGAGLLDQYVNDRPYSANSFLSVALNRVFHTAMTGKSRERADLAQAAIPLELQVTPLPINGGEELVRSLFEPLGWSVELSNASGWEGVTLYASLFLRGRMRLSDALSHLYVLIPVLDDEKHYWVGEDEIEKLLAKAGDWLPGHPQRDLITRRYLKHRRDLARLALARLAPEELEESADPANARDAAEVDLELPIRLNDLRMEAIKAALLHSNATSVVDLGCGEGKLLSQLSRERRFNQLLGLDASQRALERAAKRLQRETGSGSALERVRLLHGALTYRDKRWANLDAAVLCEVIEHLDLDRITALCDVVFGTANAKTIIVTTPNREHNALFPALPAGKLRHPDHRFEWTRQEFAAWVANIEATFGYKADVSGIGPAHATHGAPTQMAVFRR